MTSHLEEEIQQLEEHAVKVLRLLKFASRAFVIEFAGTPKAGKTTSVEAIRHFFSRQGFRVHVLIERASVCPIPMKGHLFFNTWCACTMLAELIENVDTETDVIIVDRGLFDSLVWLTLQRQRGELTEHEAKVIEAFLLLDRWRSLIDLVVVMNVSPQEAIQRENSQRISSKPGSIMNPDVLGTLSASVKQTIAQYGSYFPAVIEQDTSSGGGVKASNARLAKNMLDKLEEFLDPLILVVPRQEVQHLPLTNGGCFTEEAREQLVDCIARTSKAMKRSQAEADPDHVQMIACGVLVRDDHVFLFERKERDPKYRLYGKLTVWQGTHVSCRGRPLDIGLIRAAVVERIMRALFLSREFQTRLVGYCWDAANEQSSPHFGVMFSVDIDNEHMATDLRKKEFRQGRGHGLAGSFVTWETLLSDKEAQGALESWSLAILKNHEDFRSKEKG
jgi:predicted NUDIX family phosphoesterase